MTDITEEEIEAAERAYDKPLGMAPACTRTHKRMRLYAAITAFLEVREKAKAPMAMSDVPALAAVIRTAHSEYMEIEEARVNYDTHIAQAVIRYLEGGV